MIRLIPLLLMFSMAYAEDAPPPPSDPACQVIYISGEAYVILPDTFPENTPEEEMINRIRDAEYGKVKE